MSGYCRRGEAQITGRESFMNLTVSLPEDHLGLAGDIASQELVRQENHPFASQHASTISTALAEVQQTSDSAFTAAEVLT